MKTQTVVSIILLTVLYITHAESYGLGNIIHRQKIAIRSGSNVFQKNLSYRSHPNLTDNKNSENTSYIATKSFEIVLFHRMFNRNVALSSYSPWQDSFLREKQATSDQFDDVDLSYLSIDLFDLPPKTEDLLRRVTHVYVMGNVRKNLPSQITVNEVLHTIDAEYRYNVVPLLVENVPLTAREDQTVDVEELNAQEYTTKVLSFAAMHCIPAEVAVLLFDVSLPTREVEIGSGTYSKTLARIKLSLQNDGWKSVSFPSGLSLRMNRGFIFSRRAKYNPIPHNSILTRKLDIAKANRFIKAASIAKPPNRVTNTANMLAVIDENMLAVIDDMAPELGVKSRMSLSQDWPLKDMQTFFPRQKRLWRQIFLSFLKKTKTLYASRRIKKPVQTLALILAGAWFLVRTLLTIRNITFPGV